MPYYGSREIAGYKITAKPLCFLRRFIRYRMGNKIRFWIEVIKTDKAQKPFEELGQVIYEQFPSQNKPEKREKIQVKTTPDKLVYVFSSEI
jgi:hypothetical protein